MKLLDKVVIITGSTRGIGKAIAIKFASEGAKVVVVGTKEEKGLAVVNEIRAAGGESFCRKTNLLNEEDTNGLVQEVLNRYGKIDILIILVLFLQYLLQFEELPAQILKQMR